MNPSYPNPPEDLNARNFFSPRSEEYRSMKDLIVSELAFTINSFYCPIHHMIEVRSEGSKLRHEGCVGVQARVDLLGFFFFLKHNI